MALAGASPGSGSDSPTGSGWARGSLQYTNNLGKCETYQNGIHQNRDKPGNKRDWFISKGSPRKPRVSYHECKTRENSNFLKKGKTVISVKNMKFSRSPMMKWTLPLESSREI